MIVYTLDSLHLFFYNTLGLFFVEEEATINQ